MSYYNGPTIVTNGLVLYLDAANNKSYPGSGNAVYDLSGNGNTGTLNGPTWTNSNGGCWSFDNTDDYIQINNLNLDTLGSTRNFTIIFAAKKTAFGTGGNNTGDSRLLAASENGYTTGWRIIETTAGTPGAAFTGQQSYTFSSPSISTSVTVTDAISNRIAFCAFSQNATAAYGFLNGVSNAASFGGYTAGTNSSKIGQGGNGVGWFGGLFSFMQIYNRALSPNEVLQNYNATKTRFGL